MVNMLKEWAWLFGGIAALIGLIQGLAEFIKANRTKRADFLERLILEFNDSRMFLAKRILDDFWVAKEGNPNATDLELVNEGSQEIIEKDELRERVKNLLRHHSEDSVTGKGEQRIRQSFDDLLDFFTKLEYYFSLKLISLKELSYFEYYLKRCAYKAGGAALNYASQYGYLSLFKLLVALNIAPKNPELANTYSAFKKASRRFSIRPTT